MVCRRVDTRVGDWDERKAARLGDEKDGLLAEWSGKSTALSMVQRMVETKVGGKVGMKVLI